MHQRDFDAWFSLNTFTDLSDSHSGGEDYGETSSRPSKSPSTPMISSHSVGLKTCADTHSLSPNCEYLHAFTSISLTWEVCIKLKYPPRWCSHDSIDRLSHGLSRKCVTVGLSWLGKKAWTIYLHSHHLYCIAFFLHCLHATKILVTSPTCPYLFWTLSRYRFSPFLVIILKWTTRLKNIPRDQNSIFIFLKRSC